MVYELCMFDQCIIFPFNYFCLLIAFQVIDYNVVSWVQVTVNSGGVVFFALFNQPENDESSPKEAAAVIKFASSRMATQSERLGYEFAKWLGVKTPQVVPPYFKCYLLLHVKQKFILVRLCTNAG